VDRKDSLVSHGLEARERRFSSRPVPLDEPAPAGFDLHRRRKLAVVTK
jgi:hypothetical protein